MRTSLRNTLAIGALLVLALNATAATAVTPGITLIGKGFIGGALLDQSGLTGQFARRAPRRTAFRRPSSAAWLGPHLHGPRQCLHRRARSGTVRRAYGRAVSRSGATSSTSSPTSPSSNMSTDAARHPAAEERVRQDVRGHDRRLRCGDLTRCVRPRGHSRRARRHFLRLRRVRPLPLRVRSAGPPGSPHRGARHVRDRQPERRPEPRTAG